MWLKDICFAGVAALVGVGVAAACSADGGGPRQVGGSGAKGGSGPTGSGGALAVGGSSQSGGDGGSDPFGGIGGGVEDAGFDEDAACSTTSAQALSAVDIVWVIDNSCSMVDEIDKIHENINGSFMPKIQASPIDWRVVMFTRRGTGNLQVCVDPPLGGANCGDKPPNFFTTNCQVESWNSLELVRIHYQQPCGGTPAWGKHLRFNSTKIFVEVTDDEAGLPFANPPEAQKFDNWATNMAKEPAGTPAPGFFGTKQNRKYVFHAIIGMDPNDHTKACQTPDYVPDGGVGNAAMNPGIQYQQLAAATGGMVASICLDDWSPIFDQIAHGIVEGLSCEFTPVPPDGEELDPGKVNVVYTPNGNGTAEGVLQDNNSPCESGWRWNEDQSKVVLCGDVCERVKSDPNARVDIQLGCKTRVVPPK